MADVTARVAPCGNCPWRVGTDPNTIPGFSLHQARTELAEACPDSTSEFGTPLMACHVSHAGADWVCLGWATSEASRESLPLRMAMATGLVPAWPDLEAERAARGIDLHATHADMLAALEERCE